MVSGFVIRIFVTMAVVPSNVPRMVCGRTNFQIAAPSAVNFPAPSVASGAARATTDRL